MFTEFTYSKHTQSSRNYPLPSIQSPPSCSLTILTKVTRAVPISYLLLVIFFRSFTDIECTNLFSMGGRKGKGTRKMKTVFYMELRSCQGAVDSVELKQVLWQPHRVLIVEWKCGTEKAIDKGRINEIVNLPGYCSSFAKSVAWVPPSLLFPLNNTLEVCIFFMPDFIVYEFYGENVNVRR